MQTAHTEKLKQTQVLPFSIHILYIYIYIYIYMHLHKNKNENLGEIMTPSVDFIYIFNNNDNI